MTDYCDTTTRFINEITNRYGLTLDDIRQEVYQVSLPAKPDLVTLHHLGYAVIEPTPQPHDGFVETVPQYIDGVYCQRWRPMTAEDSQAFARLKAQRRRSLKRHRQELLERGHVTIIHQRPVHVLLDTDSVQELLVLNQTEDDVRAQYLPTREPLAPLDVSTTRSIIREALQRYGQIQQAYRDVDYQIVQAKAVEDCPEVTDLTLEHAIEKRG